MKALVGAFNQENALVGAFSMIVKTDGSFYSTSTERLSWRPRKPLWILDKVQPSHQPPSLSLGPHTGECTVELDTKVIQWFLKISQLRRRPLPYYGANVIRDRPTGGLVSQLSLMIFDWSPKFTSTYCGVNTRLS